MRFLTGTAGKFMQKGHRNDKTNGISPDKVVRKSAVIATCRRSTSNDPNPLFYLFHVLLSTFLLLAFTSSVYV